MKFLVLLATALVSVAAFDGVAAGCKQNVYAMAIAENVFMIQTRCDLKQLNVECNIDDMKNNVKPTSSCIIPAPVADAVGLFQKAAFFVDGAELYLTYKITEETEETLKALFNSKNLTTCKSDWKHFSQDQMTGCLLTVA